MNTPHIDFGDAPTVGPAVSGQSVASGRPTPLAAIEEVLASLDQAELVALLEGIKRKVDAAVVGGTIVEREGAVAAAGEGEAEGDQDDGLDAMDRANLRRQEAARELEQMVWV